MATMLRLYEATDALDVVREWIYETRTFSVPPKPGKRGIRPLRETLESVLARLVRGADECWTWQGNRTVGYGYVSVGGRSTRVHRFMYELFSGKIPDGLVLDHLCRNRACANPLHLEAVTRKVNSQRGDLQTNNVNFVKTHCLNGHPFSPENTFLYRTPRGRMGRQCLACKRERNRAWMREYNRRGESA